jgi:hypothetical protein
MEKSLFCLLSPMRKDVVSVNGRVCLQAFIGEAMRRLSRRIAVEHTRERNFQSLANLEQTSPAYAVYTLFEFLHLLKRDAQFLAQHFLVEAQGGATVPHLGADIGVDRRRGPRADFLLGSFHGHSYY